jgi:Fur family ferric uptake transcriptional regulator
MGSIRRTVVPLDFDRKAFRHTQPRQEVLRVFVEHSQPMTVAEVHTRIRIRQINLTSVYRTIHLFRRLGILVLADRVIGGQRFELSDNHRAHHHHLICEQCGSVTDFEDCLIGPFERKIRERTSFVVRRHDLQFYGLCIRCSK